MITKRLLASAGLAGCGTPDISNFELARAIINDDRFRVPRTIPLKKTASEKCSAAILSVPQWQQFRQMGLIEVQDTGTRLGPECLAVLQPTVRFEASLSGTPSR